MSSLGQADQARSQPPVWPVLSGQIPPLSDSPVTRQETGLSLTAGLGAGLTTVLIPSDELGGRGLGGTGKTQLAVALARMHHEQRMADLVVWVSATSRDAVIGGYAQALHDIGVPDQGGTQQAAAHFLGWLAGTTRPWLVVFDGLRDAATLDGCWPRGPAGRVLVTTELPDTAAQAPSPRGVPVGPFSPREALAYLSVILRTDPDQRIGAVDVASDLSCVPVALGQAAAWMTETGLGCREYRARWTERRRHPALAAGTGHIPALAATWSLSVELADQLPPAGFATRALALVSMLAPGGIPGSVLTSQAACAYVTGQEEGFPNGEPEVRAAIHNLARAGLLTVDPTSAARTVLVHPTVQAFTRQSLTQAEAGQAAKVAADGLGQIWLRHDLPPEIGQPLRDCTATLRDVTGSLLWRPECHPVLIEAGRSLDSSGLAGPAVDYWQALLSTSRRVLGEEHAQTILIRDLLGTAYQASGRVDEAIGLYEASLNKREHDLGTAHPETVVARQRLAGAYLASDHADGAIRLAERALAESEQTLGPTHPDSLAARENLAKCYLTAGQIDLAIAQYRHALGAREQMLGPRHLTTVATRGGLAAAYLKSGQLRDALAACKRTLEDREQIQGADHPDTIAARATLGSAYRSANKRKEAIRVFERTVADSERVLGRDSTDTLSARAELAAAYESARKHANAVAQYEQTFTDAERVFGPDHPFTKAARDNYNAAASYAQSVLGIDLRTPSSPGRS
jgi:tetratricopeptide (TPR) repeat protein